MTTAIAIFVKTPGHAPLKTRLAAGIGAADAETFFRLAAACVSATAREAARQSGGRLVPYWAVAEPEALADPLWAALPVIAQGEGGLGDRLAHVYATLRDRHGAVLLVGADSPQLSPADLLAAAAALDGPTAMALGPTPDGGFWVFGGRPAIGPTAWMAIPYSQADTAHCLLARFQSIGPIQMLPAHGDVDVQADLAPLAADLQVLAGAGTLSAEQATLQAWLATRTSAGAW